MMNNAVSHVRISDIEKGRKAPIKLSEFLLLCQACEVDPVTTLREIIEAARAYEARERLPSPSPSSVPATNDTASPPTPTETATSRPRPPTGDGRF